MEELEYQQKLTADDIMAYSFGGFSVSLKKEEVSHRI